MSATRTFSGVSLKIVFAVAGSALTFSATATGTVAGALAGWPGGSAASHHAISSHAAAKTALLPAPVQRARTSRDRAGPPAVELAAATAARDRSPRGEARLLLRHRFHWQRWQFKYVNRLWARESGWNRFASNPYSGAYGIPQAAPGNKMASAGRDWRYSARTQILWGMRYIKARYRTPYWAWVHSRAYGWY
ncbi:MAG TPA: hypothetical protein VIV12_01455 [Streptosporangiaceae bacterium]